jgi:hypothetical protein
MFDPDGLRPEPKSGPDLTEVVVPAQNGSGALAPQTSVPEPSIPAEGAGVFRSTGPTEREREVAALLQSIWWNLSEFERLIGSGRSTNSGNSKQGSTPELPGTSTP